MFYLIGMNPFTQKFEDLPPTLPVFPLTGVLLLPGGTLPLNIFEPRYLEMVSSALATDRLIGMIQLRDFENGRHQQKPDLQAVGCAGRITEFRETEDGRYEISLTGICRFRVAEELSVTTLHRRVKTDWTPYKNDFEEESCEGCLCKDKLKSLLKEYFQINGLSCEWERIDERPRKSF
ncbi:MAG: LON peptidase substrate-binding domain-containing protein [Alphaproteobacteria bacterium]|nr:LON peptidase substrate-binding domain-containing protein [Alphaproteobacteria bacterium]